MKKSRKLHFSSYARTVVSELKTLSTLVRKYSITAVDADGNLKDLPDLLTSVEIADSLVNPQNALKPCMSGYAYVIKVHRDIIQTMEQANAQRRMLKDSLAKLRETLPTLTIPVQQQEMQESIQTLDRAYQNTIATQKELPELEARLATFEKKLEKLAKELDQEWDAYRFKYTQQIVTDLQDNGYNLNEAEITDLQTLQPWPEILARFKANNIVIPAGFGIEDPDFTTYFKLKAYLVIYQFLARRMLPNTAEDIIKIMKHLLKS